MIRSYKPGDEAYVKESHFAVYSKEYDFDFTFKEFIENALDEFSKSFDSEKENLWIVDLNGEPKGSIGIVKITESQAQLRWFLVEPDIRGLGYGKRLLETALNFCKEKNYDSIFLWTNSSLHKARALYEKYGFTVTETKEQVLSNQLLTEERWEKIL
jgi:GNAT superfamily N-acetyltransferase